MSPGSAPHDQISPRPCQPLSGSRHLPSRAVRPGSLFTPEQHRPCASEEAQTPGGIQEGPPSHAGGLPYQIRPLASWAPLRSGSVWGCLPAPGVGGSGLRSPTRGLVAQSPGLRTPRGHCTCRATAVPSPRGRSAGAHRASPPRHGAPCPGAPEGFTRRSR